MQWDTQKGRSNNLGELIYHVLYASLIQLSKVHLKYHYAHAVSNLRSKTMQRV